MTIPFPDSAPDSVPAEPKPAAPAPETLPPATPSTGDRPRKPHKYRRFHIVRKEQNRRPNREQLTEVAKVAALLFQVSTTEIQKLGGGLPPAPPAPPRPRSITALDEAKDANADESLSGLLEVAVRFCVDHPAAVLIAAGTAWLVTEIERKHGKRR